MKRADLDTMIWPRPQEIKGGQEPAELAFPLGVRVEGDAPWLEAGASQVAQEINRVTGKRLVLSGKAQAKGTLTLTTMAALPKGLKPVKEAEGYVLSITSEGVLLAGQDARGLFYGAQTLAQLAKAHGASLPQVLVRDWPRFPYRGVHIYLPRDHFDFFVRLLDFMAEVKLNTLVLEVSGGMEYARHPEVNRAWEKFCRDAKAYNFDKDTTPSRRSPEAFVNHERTGPDALQGSRYFWKDSTHTELAGGTWLTKDECRWIKAECDKRHIEIIPEVQALSHAYYLVCAHPEIAEHADDPWPDAYCISNPKSYELLFDVMDEVIEMFQPRVMHIGHDEAYAFRICPECRKRTAPELLADDVNRIHAFLTGRGVRPLMWADKFMNYSDGAGARVVTDKPTGRKFVLPATYKAVDMVPKDLFICEWYWSYSEESQNYFDERGFEMIYGNFGPLGFPSFEKRSSLPSIKGAEMSSWCGVTPWEFGHNATYYAFFPGSDMLWRGLQMEYKEVCARMAPWMTRATEGLTGQDRWLVSGGKGKLQAMDLSPAARPLPEALAGKIETGETVQTVLETGSFDLLTSQGVMDRAVVLDRAHPKSASVPVGGKAARVVLLHATTFKGVRWKPTYYMHERGTADVLQCRVKYADGKQETFSALYSEDIGHLGRSWPGGWHCYRAVPVAAGPGHTLYAQEWVNPRPEVPIQSLTFQLGPDATDTGEVLIAAASVIDIR